MVVRQNGFYVAVQAMQATTTGLAPWQQIDLSSATVSASIDIPDLPPEQGTFNLAFNGSNTTVPVVYSIGASNLQNAFNALPSIITAGGVTVTPDGSDFLVTFKANGTQPLISGATVDLYPASSITAVTDQAGTSSLPAIQILSIQQLPATFQNNFTFTSGIAFGELQMATPAMVARFNALPPGTQSLAAELEITVQFPGSDPQTILLAPVSVLRNVIRSGAIVQPPFPIALQQGTGVESWFFTVNALSSGAGTLSGIATASGASKLGRAGIFALSGISTGWFLNGYTGQSGAGYQEPDDFNASTNPVIWQQFL